MLIFFGFLTLLLGALGGVLHLDGRHRTARDAQERADELEAARLRLVANGEDPDAPAVFAAAAPASNVYTSRHAVDTTPPTGRAAVVDEAFDQRTAILVVDPTLSVADVATIVEHVEHGTGSIRSIAAVSYDTREMRTAVEQRELDVAYDEAYAEDTERTFNGLVAGLWSTVDNAWPLIDAWVNRYHGDEHYASCVHCAEALHVQSDEYAQIVARVEAEHTGEISRTALFGVRA